LKCANRRERGLFRHTRPAILAVMPEQWRLGSTPRNKDAKVRVLRLAEQQWGVVAASQLRRLGVGQPTISRWVDDGRLQRVHRGVYAVGHRALAVEGRHAAALLYAGPEAALSHTTAAWWRGIWGDEPRRIHVSVSGRRSSLPDVVVHERRHLERVHHKHLPVTTIERTLLDLAVTVSARQLRRALAEADYRRLVDLDTLEAVAGRGLRGSAALRSALATHRPELARTVSVLEERFLAHCEDYGIPPPEVNVKVRGLMVDALWRRQRVIAELDGHAAHGTRAAMERDRRRELELRKAGYSVVRYTWQQVTRQPAQVAADLSRELGV
jgi:predicted transcriptional regulator of viral defense system